MKKRFLCLLVVSLILFVPISGYAAKNSDVIRVYKKVVRETDFVDQLYKTVPYYSDLEITEKSVDTVVKNLIRKVIDVATKEKADGVLKPDNIESRFKAILMNEVQNLEAKYISLILDSFSEETVEKLLEGIIPEEFKSICKLLAKDAYYILGYEKRGVEIIFDDMTGYEWAFQAVDYLFSEDVINGTSDFIFEPSGFVTREQFVKMICSAFEITANTDAPVFSDVPGNSWYYPYVTRMTSQGLIKGISNTEFGTGLNIKRQDMAVLMYRVGKFLGYLKTDGEASSFNDESSISDYAKTAVNTLRANSILNGDEFGNFNPHNGATRAEAAQMIYNFRIFISNQVN